MSARPRAMPGVLFLAAAVTVGCTDYAHSNPYDPNVSLSITIAGPDTLFSWDDSATYTATSSPVMPDSALHFGIINGYLGILGSTGRAYVTNLNPPLYPLVQPLTLKVNVGAFDTVTTGGNPPSSTALTIYRHQASRTIYLTQRITSIQLRCPTAHACDTLAVGGTASVWADGFDALQNPVYGLSSSSNPLTGNTLATFAVRDTTVASLVPVGIRAANVTALKSGSTWIVATRGAIADSLKLVVK